MDERTIDSLQLDGGKLCLNFINTVHDRTVEEPFEYLSSYSKLLDWAVKVEVLSPAEQEKLAAVGQEDEKDEGRVLQEFLEARKVLYDLFDSVAQKQVPGENTQAAFNALLGEAMAQLNLRITDEDLTVRQGWQHESDLKYPLYPIIKSAYDLLASDRLDRVKSCGACKWLFFDQSKNKSRKWCSMDTCGSNVKAKRYYHRNKKKE